MSTPIPAVRGRGWLNDYPPLLAIGAGLLIVLAVLPSSLNFPQSNPTQTLEYAPVPPDDNDNPPPAAGNLGSLGLGKSSGIAEAVSTPTPPAPVKGISKDASAKHCVGNPPRQTEDPSSPPCVAFFQGENFGATYQGVSKEEIRILLYVDGNYTDLGHRGFEARRNGELFDLATQPKEDDPYHVEAGRIWQRYFNERFQTYGRFARFFVYYGTGQTPEARRTDAAESYTLVKPFAVVAHDFPWESSLPYVELMASRGVLTFGQLSQRPESLFRKFPKLEWGYYPSLERQARQFSDYVCTKVVPFKVSFAGNDADADSRLHNGQPRRLGLLYSTAADDVGTKQEFAKLAKKQIEACGGKFFAQRAIPCTGGYSCGYGETYPLDNMTNFSQQGVTTVIWAQGYEPSESRAAGQINYRPEWIVAGDQSHEDIGAAKHQDSSVWDHAVVVANVPLTGARPTNLCYLAAKEVDPDLEAQYSSIPCRMYEDIRQLFTGIQVAGPRLGPTSIDEGFRAIPKRPSGTPEIPACYYEPGDYTCVKDSVAMYWDAQARSRFNSNTGCYRLPFGGKRYLEGTWPKSDALADQDRSKDPCNGWTLNRYLDPSPGTDSPPPQ